MEIVNEANFKSILRGCASWNSTRPRLVHSNYDRMILVDESSLFVWFERPSYANYGDISPSQGRRDLHDSFSVDSDEMIGIEGIPRFCIGPKVEGDQRGSYFDSMILLPFGVASSRERVVSIDVFQSDRLLIASVLSTSRLLLASESSSAETCPFSHVIFNIDHLLPLSSLKLPATVHIWANGSRVFVTDHHSDRVVEFRFDYSLVDPQRGCPDYSIVHWYLESGVPIGSNTRVSLVNPDNSSPSDTPHIQIIGTSSNGDSQGLVRLVNQRRWIPSTITPPCSISFAHNCVLVNTPNYLKLIHLNKGSDFPLTMRPPATNTTVIPSGAYFCLYAGIISAFRVDNDTDSGAVIPLSVSGLTECVDSFAIDPVIGRQAVLIVRGDPMVLHVYDLGSVSTNHVQFTFVSQHSLPSPVTCLSINQFGEWGCIAEGGIICSNCTPIQSLAHIDTHAESFMNMALCDDWFALVYLDKLNNVCLELRSLYEPAKTCSQFILPKDTRIDQLRFESVMLHGRKEKLLYGISGHIGLLCRDFLKGTFWVLERLEEQHRTCLCVLEDSDLAMGNQYEAVVVDTAAPYRVYEASLASLPVCSVSAMIYAFAACVDPEDLRSEISWAILPDTLRSRIEPLLALEKFPDTVRSTDSACRRYLIEFAFCREVSNNMRLSTEALAWAGASETQAYLIQQIVDHQSISWDSLAGTGIGFWCSEFGSLKGLAELIQKNALAEYMKCRDPMILEEKVSLWLCLLGKQQLLSTLYKQYGNSCASPVHVKVGQFLATDFCDPENAVKAKKNAFELLRQKRYYLAVSMFILGGSYREVVDLCCRQLDDVQLALFLAKVLKVVGNRVVKDETIDPIIEYLWSDRIIPYSDAWMSLLHTCSKLDLGGAVRLLEARNTASVPGSNIMSRLFSIPDFELTRHPASKLVETVQERIRRLNRPHEFVIPKPSHEDIAKSYLSRGLSGLAQTILRGSPSHNEFLNRAIELEISH